MPSWSGCAGTICSIAPSTCTGRGQICGSWTAPSIRRIVRSGRCYAGDPKTANFSPRGIGLTNTLRTWLSMWSLRDSHCRGAPHLQRITQPALVVQSTADTGVFPSDAQAIYDALGHR